MNGEQVARVLKSERPALSMILLTSHPDIPAALLSIVDSHVQKGTGDLLTALHTILNCRASKCVSCAANDALAG